MKKWAIAAVVYLLVVMGGYTIYAFVAEDETGNKSEHGASDPHASEETETTQDESATHGHSEDGHGSEQAPGNTDVTSDIAEKDGELTITIKDKAGNMVEELEVNHEKLLHLIVVDDHLEKYYHLHPEQVGPGTFTIQVDLEEGAYKAFVDIKPKNGTYHVSPLEFTVGNVEDHDHASLQADADFIKTINEIKTTLYPSSLKVGEPVTLKFDVEAEQLEHYLGAMGHVVILDEQANEFIHVHPASETGTIFETEFQDPGLYKIWAEFKVDGTVITYPFVIEIIE
ncbi:hypothetical protein [Fredinandcohnia sp. 179-A 10B2 NHS]|uniref:hypothetical protein n=1 Tax=Fredinandcohnia sp. 179-A 10B2 NHS TaxID=3235176 RepID=UPI0039A32967